MSERRYFASCHKHRGNDPRCPDCLMAAVLELLFLVDGSPLWRRDLPEEHKRDLLMAYEDLWWCIQRGGRTIGGGACV